jgi:CheY-like chemotaxis protein
VVKNSRILIVDDEPDVIQALRYRLEAAGYVVNTASNGQEALEQLASGPVDLILADFMMPMINGLQLAEIVQQEPLCLGTKVVLFSCYAGTQARARAREAGALGYLLKMDGARAIVRQVYELLNSPENQPAVGVLAAAIVTATSGPLRALSAASAGSRREARGSRTLSRDESRGYQSRGDQSAGKQSAANQSVVSEEQRPLHGSFGDDLRRLVASVEMRQRTKAGARAPTPV